MHKSIESRLACGYMPEKFKLALSNISSLGRYGDTPISDAGILTSLAGTVDLLPRATHISNRDIIYRGTLLRRLIFREDYRVISNEPTEEAEYLNATRDFEAAKFYAKSYGDELAPSDLRIDPVIITFEAKELTRNMQDQGARWRIPKRLLTRCNTGLFSVKRSITSEQFLKSIQR